jgi:two-component system, LuxR family, response regulator DctR
MIPCAGQGEFHETVLRSRFAQLSPREVEVMNLIVRGSLNKQIADQLDIAILTVEAHRGRIFEKMGVRNAVELAALVSNVPEGALHP